MPIRLIEAPGGSGKTCWVMEQLLREIDRGFYQNYYTNIEGITVCGVRPLPPDGDWRQVNPNKELNVPQLVIIDEAQYFDAYMKENRSKDNPIGKELSTHRHYGIDIWFITQNSKTYLNDYVKGNVTEHVLLYRPRNKKTIKVYSWSTYQTSLGKEALKNADDETWWRVNDHMFNFYKSTVVVTDDKTRKSNKLFGVYVTAAMLFGLIFFMIKGSLGFFIPIFTGDDAALNASKDDEPTQVEQTQDDNTNESDQVYQSATPEQLEAQRVAMVFASDTGCTAKNSRGQIIDMPFSECKRYSDDPRLLGSSYLPTTTTFDNFAVGEQFAQVDQINLSE